MAKNTEKRQRTKQSLKEALVELCQKKNYYDITVWDICNQAKVYRSTFYRYYDTKDEMLREIEHEYVRATREMTMTIRDYQKGASPELRTVYLEELTRDMEYHLQNEKLCRFLLSPAGDIYFHQKLIESVSESVSKSIQKYGHGTTKETTYLAAFFAAGFVSTIYEWLTLKNRTPLQIASFLLAMIERLQP